MLPSAGFGGHSAVVNMSLRVNGLSLRVAQMGPDFLLLDRPVNHPPGEARLSLQVDASESNWRVLLPKGIAADNPRVAIAPVG